MAVWKTIATHEADGYRENTDEIVVQKRGDTFRMVFDGPVGLETTIKFTDVEVDDHTLEFYRDYRSRGRGRTHTGSMERNTDEMVEFFTNLVSADE